MKGTVGKIGENLREKKETLLTVYIGNSQDITEQAHVSVGSIQRNSLWTGQMKVAIAIKKTLGRSGGNTRL